MFLHIGENESVFMDSVIGIFDLESTTTIGTTKNFITSAEKNGEIVITSDLMPKTFILTEKNGENRVYISALNTSTLKKRIDKMLKNDVDTSKLESFEIVFNREDI